MCEGKFYHKSESLLTFGEYSSRTIRNTQPWCASDVTKILDFLWEIVDKIK